MCMHKEKEDEGALPFAIQWKDDDANESRKIRNYR